MGRLAQAFGRLIRRADDCGTFVLLGPAVPSRLLCAFPAGTPVERVGLDEAVARVANPLAFVDEPAKVRAGDDREGRGS
jgi:ATP-dependent DNA helicase DinG